MPFGIISPQAGEGGVWITAAQFAQAVSNIVERYDGDGYQDMPGLRYAVTTWELINEYSSLGGGAYAGLDRGTFVSMMTNGAHALKTACSEAQLALDPFDTNDVTALLQNWSTTNINIISYHTYSPLDVPYDAGSISYLPNISAILTSLGLNNIPVWATEYAFYDHQGATPPGVAGSQTDNARWFVQTTVWGLGSQLLRKIIYTEVEAPLDGETRLNWMAMVDTNGVKRQIYYSFKKLASLIDNYSSVQDITVGADIYAYRFTCGTSKVAVVWCKEGTVTQENVSVSGCDGTHAALLNAVPDANGNFTVSTTDVVNSSVLIPRLDSTPIIITSASASPVIGPLITANGLVGDVSLNSGDTVAIAVQMMNIEPYVGVEVDWWVVACAGSSWFYLDSVVGWTEDGNMLNWRPAYQGALCNLPATEVLNITGLATGSYTFYFAVDYPMDGILNVDGPILVDSVNVTVW